MAEQAGFEPAITAIAVAFPPRYCSVCSPSARCHAEGIDVNKSVQGSAGAVLILEFPASAPDFLLGAAGSLL